jgi:hypothetical protein
LKLAFTICSNNYLPHAKTLGVSLLARNPEYKFVIGLVDQKTPIIDYNAFHGLEIIEIGDIGIRNFEDVWKKYNIVELNTAVKPSFAKYLFEKYPNADLLLYFDPDIFIYGSFKSIEEQFVESDILLTPHIISPITLDAPGIRLVPTESTFLNHGLYNLGFIGVKKNGAHTREFLDWWEERTLNQGFIDVENGIFVDQLWVNLVPIYFEKVKVLREMGYNAAPWNLHERGHIKSKNDYVLMPDGTQLVFFHFSSYKYKQPDKIGKQYNRFEFSDFPEIRVLYKAYHDLLIMNGIEKLSSQPCYYVEKRNQLVNSRVYPNSAARKVKNAIKAITPPFFWQGVNRIIK